MLIDSHCHLNYLDDPDSAMERARQEGVTTCLCISVDEEGYTGVKALAATPVCALRRVKNQVRSRRLK